MGEKNLTAYENLADMFSLKFSHLGDKSHHAEQENVIYKGQYFVYILMIFTSIHISKCHLFLPAPQKLNFFGDLFLSYVVVTERNL